jgi:hypothetical protein
MLLSCATHLCVVNYVLFVFLVDANSKEKGRTNASNQQASIESVNGMGGAMNEEDLETGVIKQQV